jgi:maleate isomerase
MTAGCEFGVQFDGAGLIHLEHLREIADTRQIRADEFMVYAVNRQKPTLTGAPNVREYGGGGLFGLMTPQSNPTAEPELRIMLPPTSALLAARLTNASSTLQQRLVDYGAGLGEFIGDFGNVVFDAVGFACTGTSYLTDPEVERGRIETIAARTGYPIITAAAAISSALVALQAETLALVSPYPPWLTDACRAHWERHGVTVTATLQLPSGPAQAHRIYGLTTSEVLGAVAAFDTRGAQALLLAGTGMPSLRAICALEPASALPVLSANLCLAWALARTTGEVVAGPESRLYGGWGARLACA